jgi:hypothetical protein
LRTRIKPRGNRCSRKAAQELVDRQEPLLVGVRGVSPAEGDVALFEGDESAVGDGDAMGVPSEIAQRVFRSAEERLGVCHAALNSRLATLIFQHCPLFTAKSLH